MSQSRCLLFKSSLILAALVVLVAGSSPHWSHAATLPARTLPITGNWQQEPDSAEGPAAADPSNQETEDSSAASGTDSDSAAADSAAAAELKWMERVDQEFGRYLVTPMVSVLFFDFFTGPESGSDHPFPKAFDNLRKNLGISERGWLRFGPDQVKVSVDLPAIRETLSQHDRIEISGESPDFVVLQTDGKLQVQDAAGNSIREAGFSNDGAGIAELVEALGQLATSQTNGTSVPFAVLWLLLGAIFFTLRMGFINIRAFKHAIRLVKGDFDNPEDQGEVSHFQALSAALSATVGLGNIAGVAIAISTGGPGATFWMIVIGLFGMSSKFTECTLGQMYRQVDRMGQVKGGPMVYLKEGLSDMRLGWLGIFLAFVFSLLCIGGSIGGGNTFQVVQSLGAIRQDDAFWFLDKYPWIYGIVMVTLVGLVIVGGIKSIGNVAGRVVPFMCGIYVLFAIIILILNASHIPEAFASIFGEAFKPEAIYGGFIGVLVVGITRAVFSNEAGTGSAAIAHSAAKTDIPVREGIVALLEPFIDTVVVCTMTALVIVITGAHSSPDTEAVRAAGNGAALTSIAFQSGGFVWFKYVLFAAVFLFAFSTCISWSYYGERCFVHWFGEKSSMVYKGLFLIFTFLGSVVSAANIQTFSDILILSMALPNILGVLLLSGKVRRELDAYWDRVRAGEFEDGSNKTPKK